MLGKVATALGVILSAIAAALRALAETALALVTHWIAGFAALARLGGAARQAAQAKPADQPLSAALLPMLTTPPMQRAVFSVLRAFWPTLRIGRPLVKAYPSTATVIVTRRADVEDVLRRDADFEVVYEPRMREITEGANFFLGMQPGAEYERDVSAMRLAMRRTDVAERVAPRAAKQAEAIVAAAGSEIDVPKDLAGPVAHDMVATYLGLPGPDRETMSGWATTLFWFLFNDLGASEEVGAKARAAAAGLRDWIGAEIARRKAAPDRPDDVLGRCLKLQQAGAPGMHDKGIRDNLIGLVIGAIPTLSKASTLALDELLRRPDALAGAQAAARAGDAEGVAAHVFEALRFNPHNPVVYRRATRTLRLSPATLRARTIPEGAMVFAATHSAMFDPLAIDDPRQFRTDRPWGTYIHWGYGTHICFGDAINRAVIPAILTPLLAQGDLKALAPREDGGTPFPQSLRVEIGRS
jgi:cytochrome P450